MPARIGTMNLKNAVHAIEARGALLVFPMDNRKEPPSLWSEFFPRTPMRWEWDENGDDRVARLWHLRAELSGSGRIVYGKWFRGRATCLSRDLAPALIRLHNPQLPTLPSLGTEARSVMEILDMDSPVSSKELRKLVGLQGRPNETLWTRALKELWERFLIVGYGEVDDGAFPSLAIGATRLMFEDLWEEACALPMDEALERVQGALPEDSLFLKKFIPSQEQRRARRHSPVANQ